MERPAPKMDAEGLLSAWQFDGRGGATRLPLDRALVEPAPEGGGFIWLHFRYLPRAPQTWLRQESSLDPSVVESIAEDDCRPRCAMFAEGSLLSLRGINLQRNALPEELITVHLWVDARRVLSVQHDFLSAIADFEDALARGRCPRSQGEFVADLSTRLVERVDAVVDKLIDEADELEDAVLSVVASEMLPKIAILRRVAIKLRRHIAPQREALNHFALEDDPWMGPKDRNRLRDAADRVTRFAEELDSVRERAGIIREQMVDTRAEQMNKSMLVLAVVTVVFAPMTLISGMFGMNVGGIPGNSDPEAFWALAIAMLVLGFILLWLFRKLKWI
ncbi:UNVERIFIED_ORG: zinc transporter [Xanthobacter viscosus]|jgi:zinc transporter|uniref:Zinc transporter ZntB n=1 Tax=Xanthobacter autotrophicus TaxID=280 RepID=A0A6C1KLW3_XANAU|nr:zinc transporter ZntB [Xanthobacter autotrophicus]TLX44717.1 zinc transporter ZntB [Xanthobacter autotrophicus]